MNFKRLATIANVEPNCSAGTFSETGVGPCSSAPAGSYVSTDGAKPLVIVH